VECVIECPSPSKAAALSVIVQSVVSKDYRLPAESQSAPPIWSKLPPAIYFPLRIFGRVQATERNFILKKNEKSVSTEALAEYNDLKSLVEGLLDKLPSAGRSRK
jgi:hypothetical protein